MPNPTVPPGSSAPAFRLPAVQGGDVGIEDFRGKSHVVLVFMRNRR